jgi:hypothetical protein
MPPNAGEPWLSAEVPEQRRRHSDRHRDWRPQAKESPDQEGSPRQCTTLDIGRARTKPDSTKNSMTAQRAFGGATPDRAASAACCNTTASAAMPRSESSATMRRITARYHAETFKSVLRSNRADRFRGPCLLPATLSAAYPANSDLPEVRAHHAVVRIEATASCSLPTAD